MKIHVIRFLVASCLSIPTLCLSAPILEFPVTQHAIWAYGRVAMTVDNNDALCVFLQPESRFPKTDKAMIRIVIPKNREKQFAPLPLRGDSLLICGNARGTNYMMDIIANFGWQLWKDGPGKTVLEVFAQNPITGTVIRAGRIPGDGLLIYLDAGNGAKAEAYIPPGFESMYTRLPNVGDSVTISGPQLEGVPIPAVRVGIPIQVMSDHLVFNEAANP